MVRYWGIRLGSGGEYVDQCEKGGYIAVGWNDLGDASWLLQHKNPSDAKEELEKQYKKKCKYGETKMARAKSRGQIYSFIREIKKDDIVLSPDQRHRTVLIGKVIGDYEFTKKRDVCDFRNRRRVEWIKKISRDEMSRPLRNSLGSLLTVFKIKGHDVELNSILTGKPYQKPVVTKYLGKEKEDSIVGATINFRGLVYAPINHEGVVFLFGKVIKDLGIEIEEIKQGFPDAIGRVKIGRVHVRRTIEFEFKSSDYDHLPKKCDILVCWEHDWIDCPKDIEVIELKSVIVGLSPKE